MSTIAPSFKPRKDLGVRGPTYIEAQPLAVYDGEWGHSESKLLRVCVRENWFTTLIRWRAGIQVPKHRHFGPVHAYTLSGRWHYKEYDWYATAGSYLVEQPETEHSLVVDEDMEGIFTTFGGFVDIGPNGELYKYYDAQSVLDEHVRRLEEQGLTLPHGIIAD